MAVPEGESFYDDGEYLKFQYHIHRLERAVISANLKSNLHKQTY